MKKTLLLISFCIASICTHAQKIDTTLLYGRWDLYNMTWKLYNNSNESHSLCRDSISAAIHDHILIKKGYVPLGKWTDNDSIAAADTAKIIFNEIFKTYVTYGQKGEVKALFAFDQREYEDISEDTGTYEWSEGNKIILKLGKGHPIEYDIVSLTKNMLVEKYNGLELTFTRAK